MKRLFPALLSLLLFTFLQQIAFAQDGEIKGVRLKGSNGITESVAKLMAREASKKKKPLTLEESEDAEPIYPDRRHLPQNPLSPATPGFPANAQRGMGTQQTLSPQTPGISFTGAGRTLDAISSVPPDNMGAVGPTQYIVIVNGRIKSFDKTTGALDGALNMTDATFWTSVSNNVRVSDPRIRYDRKTQRWFVVEINVASTLNRIMIAVSNGPNITSTASFTFFQFSCPAGFDDYPTLGIDDNALYIGTNNFTSTTGSFSKTNGYVINKSDIVAGALTVTSFQGLATNGSAGPFTPQGVDNFDNAPVFGYFVGVDNLSNGLLQIRRVSNAGSASPTMSANIPVTTPTTENPLGGVPFQGATSGRLLDDLGDRLFAAVIRNNRLWTAHNIQVNVSGVASTSGGRDGSRWYEIDVNPATPTLVQSGTIFDPAGANPTSYFIPSVMVSGQGHAAFGLTSAGTAAFPNTSTVGRLSNDAAGTTGTIVNTTTSTTSYNLQSGVQRWGDYSFVSLDPLDDMTMWMINEFCDATNSWGSRVTKLIAPPPATPASCNPSALATGQNSVDVIVTGTSASGSGFFDPGANIPGALPFNHISATVSGGVVVNSVTYTDPTHIILHLNTTAAGAGSQTVTVTNPDGQTISTSTILDIYTAGSPLAASPANNGPVCSGTTLNLFSHPVGGTQPYTFSWSGPNSFTSTDQNPVILNVPAANSGTYTVTVTDNVGAAASNSTNAVVKPTPSAFINAVSPFSVCSDKIPFTITAITNAASPTYLWKKGGIDITPAQTGATLSLSANGSYSVVVTDDGCSIELSPVVFTVNPTPTAPSVTVNSINVCQDATSSSGTTANCVAPPQTLTFNTATGLPISWAASPGTISATSATIAVSGFPAGYVITNVSATYNLKHTYGGDIKLKMQAPNGAPTLDVINFPTNRDINFGTVSGGGATLPYTFNSTGGALPASGDVASPGPYTPAQSFTGYNGFNPNGTWTITISDAVSQDGGTLDGISLQITVDRGDVLSDLSWYAAPTGGSPVSTNTSFDPVVDGGQSTAIPGTYTFYAECKTSAGCASARTAVALVVKAKAGISSITAGANPICPGATTTLTANGVVGDNASVAWWTAPNGGGAQVGSGVTSDPVGAGTYYARVTAGCGNPVELVITITAVVPPTISGSNQWIVDVWNAGGATINPGCWSTNYSGYYTTTDLNFNTQNQWAANGSPSDAAGYVGCPVAMDNHSFSARRKGFPCGYYSLDVPNHDDAAQLFVNGVNVWEHVNSCCDSHPNVWSGWLGSNDSIVFRVTEGGGGSLGVLSFTATPDTLYTWLGTASTDWENPANWGCGMVPPPGSNVIIPNTANQPSLTGNATIGDLKMLGQLSLNGKTLTINGAVTGSGTFTGYTTSTLVIGGNAGILHFTAGSAVLYALTIKPGATATVAGSLLITGPNSVPVPVTDNVRTALSTSVTAYDNAADNSWVSVTQAEYNNLLTTVSGAGRYGSSETYMLTTPNNGWTGNYTVGGNPNPSKVPASSYIIAWSVKTGILASSATNSKLKVSASQTSGYTDYGSPLPDIGTLPTYTRVFFVLKKPHVITPASPCFTAVYNVTTGFLGNSTGSGLGPEYYQGSDISYFNSGSIASDAYSQVICTQTLQW